MIEKVKDFPNWRAKGLEDTKHFANKIWINLLVDYDYGNTNWTAIIKK